MRRRGDDSTTEKRPIWPIWRRAVAPQQGNQWRGRGAVGEWRRRKSGGTESNRRLIGGAAGDEDSRRGMEWTDERRQQRFRLEIVGGGGEQLSGGWTGRN